MTLRRACGVALAFALATACAAPPSFAPPELPAVSTDRSPQEADLAAAWGALQSDPSDVDAIVWFGRRTAYLGRYDDAVAIYSEGLRLHPRSPHLLRHRGHRYVTLHRFEDAIADFERAAALTAGKPDEVEPDGIPNAQNIPTSTLHTNIHYHLGLARYCRGEFASAERAYRDCLAAAKNPDMEVATRYWLYLTQRQQGDVDGARETVEPVRWDWNVIENHVYHRLLLLYRGDLPRDEVVPGGGGTTADAVQSSTAAYGLARHAFHEGDEAAGEAALRRLVEHGRPQAFGCIAATSDLERLEDAK